MFMAPGKQNSGNCLPVAAVVFAVMNVLIKQALDEGMSRFVLITYRQFVATIFISPIAYYAERGGMCSGMAYIIMAWCVEKRGPVFTSAFSPLIQVVVAIIEVLFLHEQLHLGSILGSIIIVIGLYMLLCGKSKQHECLLPKQIQVIDDSTAV